MGGQDGTNQQGVDSHAVAGINKREDQSSLAGFSTHSGWVRTTQAHKFEVCTPMYAQMFVSSAPMEGLTRFVVVV